jgi:hypothetical protein
MKIQFSKQPQFYSFLPADRPAGTAFDLDNGGGNARSVIPE